MKSEQTNPLTDADQELFHELYQTRHRRVYSICLRMTQDNSVAEDLTHEVFVQLFRLSEAFAVRQRSQQSRRSHKRRKSTK
jgi:DNA-directed RNA polymerase specialized sigma24 family protein